MSLGALPPKFLMAPKSRPSGASGSSARGPKTRSRAATPSTTKVLTPQFVTCAPGLEVVLHEEIKALRFAKVERQVGGVYFEGDERDAMRANLELRTAVRVLRRVARFSATQSDELYEGAAAVDWKSFLAPGATLLVAAQTRLSELDHSHFIEQRIKDAICDRELERSGARPSIDKENPDLRVHAHLFKDRCTLSVDTSGDSLHKRGWRRFQGQAPLSETLAAGLVLLSGWDRRSPLVDPFCGSGTLLIEAALIAADRAPGLSRSRFGFQNFPGHREDLWQRMREEAKQRARPLGKLPLLAREARSEILEGARENFEAAGVAENVQLEQDSAQNYRPRSGWNAWILTNPPYGERVGDVRELSEVYRRFGERLRQEAQGYRLALFSGNRELDGALGISFSSRIALANGALPCELCLASL